MRAGFGIGSFLIFGFVTLGTAEATNSQTNDFQIREALQEKAKIYSSHDRRLVFRLFTQIEMDALRRQQSGGSDAAHSLDLVIGPDGAIEEFAINRFNDHVVFQVDRESERLRFLRLRDASSVFRDLGFVSEALATTADFAYQYMTQADEEAVRSLNLRVLRAIRAFDDSSEKLISQNDTAKESQAALSDGEIEAEAISQVDPADRLQFLEDLDQDVGETKDTDPATQAADLEAGQTNL